MFTFCERALLLKQALYVVALVPEAALPLGTLHHFTTFPLMADTIKVAAILCTGSAAEPVSFWDAGQSHATEVEP